MPNTALKLDRIYTSRFTTGVAPSNHYFQSSGPTVVELHRRRRSPARDFRGLVLEEDALPSSSKSRRRRRRRKLSLRSIIQGGLEVGAFGTILATFMGSLWALAQ